MAEDPGEIREAITRTRADIAATMQELGDKADVKARVSGAVNEKAAAVNDKAVEWKDQAAASQIASEPPGLAAMAAIAGVTVAVMLVWSRLRRRRH